MNTDANHNNRIKALEYLVEKLILDGEELAKTAELFQAAINAYDSAAEAVDDAETEEQSTLAHAALSDAEEHRSEYYRHLRLAIHQFRKRTASADTLNAPKRDIQQASFFTSTQCENSKKTYWPQEPFAYFQRNEGWNTWEEVIPEAKNQPGVVAAYRLLAPGMSPQSTDAENVSTKTTTLDTSREQLRLLLTEAREHVDSQNKADEGFGGRKPRPTDSLLARIDAAIKTPQSEDVAIANPATLLCGQCGADRLKEDCKGDRSRCAINGTTQSANHLSELA